MPVQTFCAQDGTNYYKDVDEEIIFHTEEPKNSES